MRRICSFKLSKTFGMISLSKYIPRSVSFWKQYKQIRTPSQTQINRKEQVWTCHRIRKEKTHNMHQALSHPVRLRWLKCSYWINLYHEPKLDLLVFLNKKIHILHAWSRHAHVRWSNAFRDYSRHIIWVKMSNSLSVKNILRSLNP